MTEKEIGEIRRRYRAERSCITRVRGCYVNDKREIAAEFSQSLGLMSGDEAEELLAILKKTLSGGLGRNLLDIAFDTKQVMEGEEHRLLMTLRSSEIGDDGAVRRFYEQIIGALELEGSYLIILAHDSYDVPAFAKDGEKLEADEVFSYILCSICPVKQTKPALGYYPSENRFKNISINSIVSAPVLGFMFPAFDDRRANIHNAVYYTRDIKENHQELADAVFRCELPMPAAAQKETFQSILKETVAEECDYEVMQTVHEQICELVELHKTNKEEPLVITKRTVRGVLESCEVSDERVNAFEERYDEAFGEDAELSPKNIINTKKFELSTPDVTINVNPERSDLVQTRIIDGLKYILIRANEGVEVNGVSIHIAGETK